ncbi:ribosomal protection-like ABC-F family protein [Spirochaeta isovalerica]|uniref:ATP-binding cassette subfamily F protein 3 n=1 Tax=Spirochaeta isovalerica TaxID=150 RepID=A0A841R6A4_9SPIO|nr:ABC-F family ATP-binding cassette domain-containing protein [Spirochaeta isovalerica]MBB6480724.1 ATP-binding cassette subfamily F protein 3 [Spirochaeta isovalerica]
MINIINLSKYYGTETVFDNISLKINPNEKTGLVGPNGCGKTTLIKMITGGEEPSRGNIIVDKNVRIGYVPQYIEFDEALSVREVMMLPYQSLSTELRELEDRMSSAEETNLEKILNRYQQVRDEYDAIEGDTADLRAEKILDSLGLEGRLEQPVETLSGGEKNVLAMAKALLLKPDLLILDEPGNHLDYKGLAWLEQFLSDYREAVLIVSHNRYLLDRVCERIIAVEGNKTNDFAGNYSYYRMNRLKSLVNQQSDYVANQKKLKRIEALVKKFQQIATATCDPAWGQRLRAMKSRYSQEEKNAVDRPEVFEQKIKMDFQADKTKADIALQINGYSKAFGELKLFNDASAEIHCGEKVALIGPNGCGKTTLIRDIVKEGNWDSDILRVGPSLTIGYCSQHQEIFNPEETIEDEIRGLGQLSRSDAFKIVAPFNFTWEDMEKKTGSLSGGEKNRLQMARLIYLKTNFLILDEPTNHLDILSSEAVEEALADFEGTLLVVSHDRYFLEKTVDRIIEVRDGKLVSFDGSFSRWWASANPVRPKSSGRISTRGSDRREDRKNSSDKGAEEELKVLESRIETMETEKSELESSINDAFTKGDHKKGRELSVKLEKLSRQLDELWNNL